MITEIMTIAKENLTKSSDETIPGRVYSYGRLVRADKGYPCDINKSNLNIYLEDNSISGKRRWMRNRIQVLLDLEQKRYLDKK